MVRTGLPVGVDARRLADAATAPLRRRMGKQARAQLVDRLAAALGRVELWRLAGGDLVAEAPGMVQVMTDLRSARDDLTPGDLAAVYDRLENLLAGCADVH